MRMMGGKKEQRTSRTELQISLKPEALGVGSEEGSKAAGSESLLLSSVMACLGLGV
jgi:hypothetical protein